MELPFAECYKIKVVEPIRRSTRAKREEWLRDADYNLFNLRSEQVYIDLLTDSGTGAMSNGQWSAMMLGDESYAGSTSFHKMANAVKSILGFDYCLPIHQGRGAENVLHSCLVKEGDIIPGNTHFDTTKGHIELRKATAVDCTIDEAFDTGILHDFKGNIDLKKLESVLSANPSERIPMVVVTVTCNSAGGQPVSMKNLREVSQLAKQYGTLVCFDAARFAENAYFIKMREEGYQHKTIKAIVREMFSFADMATMSAKKDAIVNIGGFLAFRNENLYQQASTYNILFEGFVTYGGMAGRDMEALAVGLDENTEFETLETRIKQVEFLADKLEEYEVPIQRPVGGHGIYVDARQLLNDVPKEEFPAQTLNCELYLEAGIRGVEIGTLLADRDPTTGLNRYPKCEFLRLAIPRRTYTNNHMLVVAAALKNVLQRCHTISHGLQILWEADIMRHFTVKLSRVEGEDDFGENSKTPRFRNVAFGNHINMGK